MTWLTVLTEVTGTFTWLASAVARSFARVACALAESDLVVGGIDLREQRPGFHILVIVHVDFGDVAGDRELIGLTYPSICASSVDSQPAKTA